MTTSILLAGCAALVACSSDKPGKPAPPQKTFAHHAEKGDVAVVGATLVPMDKEGTVAGQTVLVRRDKIVLIAPEADVDVAAAQVIDGHGNWLVPGLADMHTHNQSESNFALYLLNGVTMVRDLYGSPQHVKWRAAIAAGELDGPTLVTAGPIIDGDPPFWPGSDVVTTAEQARAAVQAQKQAGYDWIKVYNGLSVECYDAILDEAKAQGLPVGGHVPKAVGIDKAIAGGQRTIEHLDGYLPFKGDDHVDDATIAATVRAGVWNCPTLVVTDRFGHLDDLASLDSLHGMEFVASVTKEGWNPKNDFRLKSATPEIFAKFREKNAVRRALVAKLPKAGAKLVLGTDTGNPYVIPGFAVHDELALLVASGLSRWQALRMATAAPAELLGTPGAFGVIAVGARADLLLVDGDPLADLGALAAPPVVIVRGKVHRHDQLLASARTATQPAAGDPFAKLPAIEAEGTLLATATYEVLFHDKIIGRDRAVLSRTSDGTRVVRGQAVFDPPQKLVLEYRATRDTLDATLNGGADHLLASRQGDAVVVTQSKADPVRLVIAADAVVAPQAIAEFFWYADVLADVKVGAAKIIAAAEVTTDSGLKVSPASFTFTRVADEDGRRVYDVTGKYAEFAVTGRFSVDADGAPHEVALTLPFGSFVMRRTPAEAK